jgi:hypothetical protein
MDQVDLSHSARHCLRSDQLISSFCIARAKNETLCVRYRVRDKWHFPASRKETRLTGFSRRPLVLPSFVFNSRDLQGVRGLSIPFGLHVSEELGCCTSPCSSLIAPFLGFPYPCPLVLILYLKRFLSAY